MSRCPGRIWSSREEKRHFFEVKSSRGSGSEKHPAVPQEGRRSWPRLALIFYLTYSFIFIYLFDSFIVLNPSKPHLEKKTPDVCALLVCLLLLELQGPTAWSKLMVGVSDI